MSRRPTPTPSRAPTRATHASTTTAAEPRHTSPRRLHPTRNDLRVETRVKITQLLNQRLADCIDLNLQCKQAHWNVRGENFIALHLLFDDVFAAVTEYVDLIAERIVQLGGMAEGTVQAVADRSTLDAYPLALSDSRGHVEMLSNAIAEFGHTVRQGIDEAQSLEDADTADILTEISRGLDKWLWFIEAHEMNRVATSTHGESDGARHSK